MSLTNEDQDLIDRRFDDELTDNERTQFDEKLKQEDFRQAVYQRELVEERIQAIGREQLKNRLKVDLRAQRTETAPEANEAPVRSMPDRSGRSNTVRWAIAASVAIALAAALFILLPQGNDSADEPPITEAPEQPMPGNQTETPTYGDVEAYGQYNIPTEGARMIQSALLQVDTSRSEAQFQMIDGTLYIYYPTELPEDAALELTEEESMIFITVEGDQYQIDPATLTAEDAQRLERVE